MDLEAVRRQAGPCPECGARLARPVLYGMPTLETVEQYGDAAVFAGCLVPAEPRPYACGQCSHWYGPVGR